MKAIRNEAVFSQCLTFTSARALIIAGLLFGVVSGLAQPTPPGGGGGGGTNYPPSDPPSAPNYGTNLWIALGGISSSNFVGMISNSPAAVELEIQSKANLLQSNWNSEGFVLGSTATNWTPMSVSLAGRTNSSLFFRIRSWIDSQNVGIPDWWQIEFFGTNGINPY